MKKKTGEDAGEPDCFRRLARGPPDAEVHPVHFSKMLKTLLKDASCPFLQNVKNFIKRCTLFIFSRC